MTRKLGKQQLQMIQFMASDRPGESFHRQWYPGCGWCWNSYSQCVRLLDSLARAGMVEKGEITIRTRTYPKYTITDAGREAGMMPYQRFVRAAEALQPAKLGELSDAEIGTAFRKLLTEYDFGIERLANLTQLDQREIERYMEAAE